MSSSLSTILTAAAISVVTTAVTAAFTYLLYWPKVKADLKKEYASKFNDKKWEVYSEVAAALSQLLTRPLDDANNRHSPDPRTFQRGAGNLWLVGSDEVFCAYNRLLREIRALRHDRQRLVEAVKKVGPIIIEMRKDLGYEATEITTGDLLTPFITDIDEHV